mgnify:CR=1 FL=1
MNDLNVFIELKDTLTQLESVVEKLIIKSELDLQFAQDHIEELIKNAKDIDDSFEYLDEHSKDEELTEQQLKELNKIIAESNGNSNAR